MSQALFPVNNQGLVPMVPQSQSVAPYTYQSGMKLDANGRVVIPG